MSLNTSTVWEVRVSGNNNNGGGFYDRNPGTSVDYSQQDTAQLTLSDLVTDAPGTGLSSATGGFTAAMVGSIIHIVSGTGFTPGFYEIVASTDTNNVTIDRSAGASASAGTGSVGGAVASPEEIDSVIVIGNTVHVKSGTYTLSGAVSFTAGNIDNRVMIAGYNSSRGDTPTGNNRPLIAAGSNSFYIGAYSWFMNFRLTIVHPSGLYLLGSVTAVNCEVVNSAGGTAIKSGISGQLIDCEASCTNGTAIEVSSSAYLHGCLVYDSIIGFKFTDNENVAIFCIAKNCSYAGVLLGATAARSNQRIVNGVLYNCYVGIRTSGISIYNVVILNNIFEGNDTGMSITGSSPLAYLDYNNWHDNGTDVSGVSKGSHATANDPQFSDPDNNDFSLPSNSPCIGAGFATRLGVG